MADKLDRQRNLTWRIARKGNRRCRRNGPARGGSAGKGRSPVAQDECRHARFFRCQDQLPARRQVERPRFPPRLDHKCADPRAPQNIGTGAQGAKRIRCRHKSDPARIDPEFDDARRINPAVLALPLVLADPEDRPGVTGANSQHQRKAAGRGMVFGFRGAQFVKRTARQPAPEPCIDSVVPERKKTRPATRALQAFETALQPRERDKRIGHDVPILF